MCAELGVQSIGLNLWPKSRRHLTLAQARKLIDAWPQPGPERVGVFVEASPDEVAYWHRELHFDLIQPHGERSFIDYLGLGIACAWVIRGTPAIDELVQIARRHDCSRILLDAAVTGYGGAGKQTDWDWAQRAVTALQAHAPVWLAGGIRPENAAEALAKVRPAGLDVASGAEQPGAEHGEKDRARVAGLVAACRRDPTD